MPADFSTIDKLGAALSFHRERHMVLAGNIANLDTPGYRPLDLERKPAADSASLAITNPNQIDSGGETGDYITTFDAGGNLSSPDGNAVSLEREMAKIDANRTRYSTSAELVSRRIALLRYCAGDGT